MGDRAACEVRCARFAEFYAGREKCRVAERIASTQLRRARRYVIVVFGCRVFPTGEIAIVRVGQSNVFRRSPTVLFVSDRRSRFDAIFGAASASTVGHEKSRRCYSGSHALKRVTLYVVTSCVENRRRRRLDGLRTE